VSAVSASPAAKGSPVVGGPAGADHPGMWRECGTRQGGLALLRAARPVLLPCRGDRVRGGRASIAALPRGALVGAYELMLRRARHRPVEQIPLQVRVTWAGIRTPDCAHPYSEELGLSRIVYGPGGGRYQR
jgi:hypothetical protein